MKFVFVYFIPTLDENDGKLSYVAEPFIKQKFFEKAVIVMPQEFSIVLEDEEQEKEPSKIVKLTFWDLFENLPETPFFVIYHDSDLDAVGSHLESLSHQFWGANGDPILDSIYISRKLYSWLSNQLECEKLNNNAYYECLKFHKKHGLFDINENDETQKPLFERALRYKRNKLLESKRTRRIIYKVKDAFEREFYKKAFALWEELKEAGRILYFPPGQIPII